MQNLLPRIFRFLADSRSHFPGDGPGRPVHVQIHAGGYFVPVAQGGSVCERINTKFTRSREIWPEMEAQFDEGEKKASIAQ